MPAYPLPSRQTIQRLVHRARSNPLLIGWVLARFRHRTHTSEATLARWLDVRPDQLPALALCRRPDSASAAFVLEVTRIAAAVGRDPAHLATVLTSDGGR